MSWWAEPGRAGWFPDAWDCSAFPAAFAGLALGGARVVEPGAAPLDLPAPGISAARRALGWSDTVAVELMSDPAWSGYGAPLAEARATSEPPGAGRASAVLQLTEGYYGYENDALGLQRGDASGGLGIEMVTGTRGAAGALEQEGRHQWGVEAHHLAGRHRFAARYAQRGTGERLAGGEEQNAAGESGTAEYEFQSTQGTARLQVERGYAHHESHGGALAYSRRDADEDRAALELARRAGGNVLELRAEWRRADAVRVTSLAPEFDRSVNLLWGSARLTRDLGPGRLRVSLGVGRDDATDRTEAAPALEYRFGGAEFGGRLTAARLVAPVWSDLAAGQTPFLQSTWAAGGELGAARGGLRARLIGITGRTEERALVSRQPLEELWLRPGLRADTSAYRFALGGVAADARFGPLGAGGEGFVLGRDRGGAQPQVDPSWGARAFADWRFSVFQGDLGIVVRGEFEWVGERETEEPVPRRLGGLTGLGATLVLTLADATLSIRGRNLDNRPQPQTWIDSATGEPALSPGREIRGTLTWRLFN